MLQFLQAVFRRTQDVFFGFVCLLSQRVDLVLDALQILPKRPSDCADLGNRGVGSQVVDQCLQAFVSCLDGFGRVDGMIHSVASRFDLLAKLSQPVLQRLAFLFNSSQIAVDGSGFSHIAGDW